MSALKLLIILASQKMEERSSIIDDEALELIIGGRGFKIHLLHSFFNLKF